jgi:hypothetical protein
MVWTQNVNNICGGVFAGVTSFRCSADLSTVPVVTARPNVRARMCSLPRLAKAAASLGFFSMRRPQAAIASAPPVSLSHRAQSSAAAAASAGA